MHTVQVKEVPPFSRDAIAVLNMLATTFSVEQAKQVRVKERRLGVLENDQAARTEPHL